LIAKMPDDFDPTAAPARAAERSFSAGPEMRGFTAVLIEQHHESF
jgi:hypothetical protein